MWFNISTSGIKGSGSDIIMMALYKTVLKMHIFLMLKMIFLIVEVFHPYEVKVL